MHILKHSIFTLYILRPREDSDESWLSKYTWALRTAGVLCAGGVLTKKRWADFSLTQDTSTVACTLCARIDTPCLSFYEVLPARSMTDWWTGELWLLHNDFIWEKQNWKTGKINCDSKGLQMYSRVIISVIIENIRNNKTTYKYILNEAFNFMSLLSLCHLHLMENGKNINRKQCENQSE